jgi:hypothetical protein
MWKYFPCGLTADASLMGNGREWGRTAKGRKMLVGVKDVQLHKVLTYVDYRAVSGVFQNIDPPPTPSPPSECVLPPHQRRGGGVHTRRAVGGGQYFGRRQTLDWSLIQYNLSTYN